MADDISKSLKEEEPVEAEESGKKRKNKKQKKAKKVHPKGTESKVIKILIRVLIVTGIVLAEVAISYLLITRFLMPDKSEEVVADQEIPKEEKKEKEKKEKKPDNQAQTDDSAIDYSKEIQIVTLNDIVVNPAFSSGKRFLAMSIVLAMDDEEVAGRVTEREPMLRDSFLTLLSQKTYSWLSDFGNREVLKGEILANTKEILQCSGGVYIYFTKYVLQ